MDKRYTIRDLVDIDRLRALFESFSKATGFTTGFVSYPDQELLITTGWREICTQFHRACPAFAECCKESNVYLTACLKDLKELSIKPCGNGLVDGATPVIIRGRHVASLATGQVLLAPPDLDFFKGLASKYGYDTDQYLAALAKVPVVTEEQLKNALIFLSNLAVQIAEEGLSRLQIQETADELREEVDRQVAKQTVELQIQLAERKRAEEALRKSESLLRGVFDNAPFELWARDANGCCIMENAALVKHWGSLLGTRPEDAAISTEDLAVWQANNRRAYAGELVEAEVDYTVDGEKRCFHNIVAPIRAGAKIEGILGLNIDITERKRTEEAIKESEQRFRELVEQAPDAIIVHDLDLDRWVSVNRSAEVLFGSPREELLTGGPLRFYPPNQPDGLLADESVRDHIRRALAGESVTFQRAVRNAQGKDLICEMHMVRQPSTVSRLVRISIIDVTDRRRAEQALREAKAKLKAYSENLEKTVAARTARLQKRTVELQIANAAISESEASLRALSDNIPNGYAYKWLRTEDGRSWFEYISAGVERIYGITAVQALADDQCLFQRIHSEDAPRLEREAIKAALNGHVFDAEGRIITPAGEVRWVNSRATSHRLENGDTLSDGIVMDITERKRSEEALKRAHRTLYVLKECDEAMIRATSEPELLNNVCRILMDIWGACLTWVGFAENDAKKTVRVGAYSGHDADYIGKLRITWADQPRGRGPAGTAIRTRQVCICRNIGTDPQFNPWRKEALKRGFSSAITLPMISGNQCLGALMVYSTQPDAFNDEEVGLLKQLAGDLAYGIISLRTRAERDQLQEELLRISEREKQLIAQELHDGLCQHFAGTAMMASLLQRRLAAREDSEANCAKQICDLLNTGVLETRNLSHGLHPVQACSDGLMEALAGLAQTVTNLFHIQCSFRCNDSVLIDDRDAATHMFRITQESVNNAIRHGQASQVILTLKNTDEGVILSIRDNGIGIPGKLPVTGGMGMRSMKHRARAIGAELSVHRAGKRGTVVTCTLPPR